MLKHLLDMITSHGVYSATRHHDSRAQSDPLLVKEHREIYRKMERMLKFQYNYRKFPRF